MLILTFTSSSLLLTVSAYCLFIVQNGNSNITTSQVIFHPLYVHFLLANSDPVFFSDSHAIIRL